MIWKLRSSRLHWITPLLVIVSLDGFESCRFPAASNLEECEREAVLEESRGLATVKQ